MATLVASNAGTVFVSHPAPDESDKFGGAVGSFFISSEDSPVLAVAGTRYLTALQPKVATAIEETLGLLPEVEVIAWSTVRRAIRIVSFLSDRSDEAIMRVADKEMQFMERLRAFTFEFRTAETRKLGAFLEAGYVPIFEKRRYVNCR